MVKFIAEVCSNHNRNLNRCLSFVDAAAKINCYSVKFQLFKINQLFSSEVLKKSKVHRERKKWELPEKFIPAIAERCLKKKIKFSCTPFYLDAVDFLKEYVDFFKISSYDILRHDLLEACAKTKKPVIISTGMASTKEVDEAYKCLKRANCKKITILHCVSNYPTEIKNSNLGTIKKINKKYDCEVGWSDHTKSFEIVARAAQKWNAKTIEFHLDLDGKGREFKMNHCWLPAEIEPVIRFINGPHIYDKIKNKKNKKNESLEKKWRSDPEDGLRPIKRYRLKI
mgnify:FL=1